MLPPSLSSAAVFTYPYPPFGFPSRLGREGTRPGHRALIGERWGDVRPGLSAKYSESQFKRRQALFAVTNAPLTGQIELTPKLFFGFTHESIARGLLFGAWVMFVDLLRRWWYSHDLVQSLPLNLLSYLRFFLSMDDFLQDMKDPA